MLRTVYDPYAVLAGVGLATRFCKVIRHTDSIRHGTRGRWLCNSLTMNGLNGAIRSAGHLLRIPTFPPPFDTVPETAVRRRKLLPSNSLHAESRASFPHSSSGHLSCQVPCPHLLPDRFRRPRDKYPARRQHPSFPSHPIGRTDGEALRESLSRAFGHFSAGHYCGQ